MLSKFGENGACDSYLTSEVQIKSAGHVEEVNKSIKFIIEKFEEIEEDIDKKERQISELENDAKFLN